MLSYLLTHIITYLLYLNLLHFFSSIFIYLFSTLLIKDRPRLDTVCFLGESSRRRLVDFVLLWRNPLSAMIIVVMCYADGRGRSWFTISHCPWGLGSDVYSCLDCAMQPVYPGVCLFVFLLPFSLSDLPVVSKFFSLIPSDSMSTYVYCLQLFSLSFYNFQLFLRGLPHSFFCHDVLCVFLLVPHLHCHWKFLNLSVHCPCFMCTQWYGCYVTFCHSFSH